jgi:hypothetical protein
MTNGEINPDLWIRVLWQYGPSAVVVFLVVVVERRSWQRWSDGSLPAAGRWIMPVVYSGVWLGVVATLVFSVYVWSLINLPGKVVVHGTFENLNAKETVDSPSPVYLHRSSISSGPDHYDYKWWLIPDRSLTVGDTITFTFSRSKRGEGGNSTPVITDYMVPIEQNYLEGHEIHLQYDRKDDAVFLAYDQKKTKLSGEDELDSASIPRNFSLATAVAYAAEVPSVQDISDRLDSDDPIIRRNARRELSMLGAPALPIAEQILENEKSPARSREGTLLALAYMKDPAAGSPSPTLLNAVILANAASDEDLRSAARHYLAAWASPELASTLDKRIQGTTALARSRQYVSPDATQVSLAQLEILYNLGVRETNAYVKTPSDLSHFQAAVTDFETAYLLERNAKPEARVFSAKALFGWGLALHERSWLQLRGDNKRYPQFVADAQAKFQQFLNAVQESGRPNLYPYPAHLQKAHQYTVDPSPKSLA